MTEANSNRKQLPTFASEAEEANWWDEHREEHAAGFIEAAAEGRVRVTTLADRLLRLRGETTLKLEAEDRAKAERLARQRGVSTTLFLETLVHEALSKEPIPRT